MPLAIEIRSRSRWVPVGPPLEPDLDIRLAEQRVEGGGSLSHNGPAGRQVYWFACLSDCSVIMRSRGGADVLQNGGAARVIHSHDGFEEIARLDFERPHFECWLRPDGQRELQRFRFRHE